MVEKSSPIDCVPVIKNESWNDLSFGKIKVFIWFSYELYVGYWKFHRNSEHEHKLLAVKLPRGCEWNQTFLKKVNFRNTDVRFSLKIPTFLVAFFRFLEVFIWNNELANVKQHSSFQSYCWQEFLSKENFNKLDSNVILARFILWNDSWYLKKLWTLVFL